MELNLVQHDMAKTLTDSYDCIGKLDALKFICSIFPYTPQRLSNAVAAYNSIEKYQ